MSQFVSPAELDLTGLNWLADSAECALLYHILMTYTDMKDLIKTKADEDLLIELLLHIDNSNCITGTIPI